MSDRIVVRVTVPRRIEMVRPAAACLVEAARALQVPAAAGQLFEVAIVEALNNAISHNAGDDGGTIHGELELSGRSLVVRVLDEAARAPYALTCPVGPAPWPAPTPDAWETVRETGYGLYLMQAVFPDVRAVTRDGRHGIEMALTF